MTDRDRARTLAELEQALEKATGQDRGLDLELMKQAKWCDPTAWYDAKDDCLVWNEPHPEAVGCPSELLGQELPKFTASIDSAVALCERVLPDWMIELRGVNKAWDAGIWPTAYGRHGHWSAHSATPALALCLAIVRTLNQQEKERG